MVAIGIVCAVLSFIFVVIAFIFGLYSIHNNEGTKAIVGGVCCLIAIVMI
jgi:hypothetical protein